jgi:hypothetical protein
MSNTAPTTAAPKAEPKEKEAPAAPPKAEKAEHEAKPKEKAAHDTDDSDDSSDSEDEKDPEKKAKKKAKKAEKAKNASANGNKPKKEKDAGPFACICSVGRQEHTDRPQQESTLTRNTTQTSLPELLVRPLQHPYPSLLHHLTTHHHYHIQSHSHPNGDGSFSHKSFHLTNVHKTTQLHQKPHLPQSQPQPSSPCLPSPNLLLRHLSVKRLSPITRAKM